MEPSEADPEGRLFVYGTLRSGAETPGAVAALLRREAGRAVPARIRARLFDAGGFPAAVPWEGSEVVGELLRLRRPEPTLAVLDRYEGCGGEDPLFRRATAAVRREDGDRGTAWVYFWDRPVEGLREIPSGDWLAADGGSDP